MRIALWIFGFFMIECSTTLTTEKKFRLWSRSSYGPQRLSSGWTDHSLLACMASCVTWYPTRCQSFMYNHVSQICTPGQWLDQSEPVPNADEGDLYATHQCDVSKGFQLHTYNDTTYCLYWHSTKLNYTNADAMCQSMNAYLSVVQSFEKLQLLRNIQTNGMWIGLDDTEQEGRYLWKNDGTELDSSLVPILFHPGEPNNRGNEDCINLLMYGSYLLRDAKCHDTRRFYCERDYF